MTRSEYERGALSEDDLAPTWHEQFANWLDDAVASGIPEPAAMQVATAALDAGAAPSVRTVLLRGSDERGFVFHTNHESRKGRELAENPRAAIAIVWVELQRQVLADGRVERLSDAESDAYWATRPHKSRLGALASPQSRTIEREELEARFAELSERYPEGSEIPRPEWWGGYRVVPDKVEFWSGRRDRLHDRLRFRHTAGEWIVERLAP